MDANTVGTGSVSRALRTDKRVLRGGGRGPYQLTFVVDRIVEAADMMEAMERAGVLGLSDIISVTELA